jgi:hypothetical protein
VNNPQRIRRSDLVRVKDTHPSLSGQVGQVGEVHPDGNVVVWTKDGRQVVRIEDLDRQARSYEV